MRKDEFLRELRTHLGKLPEKEREEILSDYEEHFHHGLHKGRTEQEITQALGHPRKLAKELIAEFHLERAKEDQSYVSLIRAAFTTLGLGFFNLVFVLGPFVAVLGVIVALYATAIAMVITPLAAVASPLLLGSSQPQFLLTLFASLILAGIGLLLGMGMIRFSRAFFGWFVRYLKSNLNIIKGVNKDE